MASHKNHEVEIFEYALTKNIRCYNKGNLSSSRIGYEILLPKLEVICNTCNWTKIYSNKRPLPKWVKELIEENKYKV